ncbi:Beta-carotene 3-hydroxylase 1 [Spatholobus suberectus]|nr:Beta-carotene 3-hydroxylase 1 [Spatholobus suberectus]
MAAGLSTATISKPYNLLQPSPPLPKPTPPLFFNPSRCFHHSTILRVPPPRRMSAFTVCVLTEDPKRNPHIKTEEEEKEEEEEVSLQAVSARVAEKLARKRSQRFTYLVAAVMSSFGVTSMAVFAVYYRFSWQMEVSSHRFVFFGLSLRINVGLCWHRAEMFLGLKCSAHFPSPWVLPWLWNFGLDGLTELFGMLPCGTCTSPTIDQERDHSSLTTFFAIINAVPAIALLSYGFFHKGLVPGLCFGAGLGITVFGMAYMFVHDGLVHKRFPVGPIANVPYFRRVAAAHQLHHSDKFNGVPYGLFLGPKEVEEVGGLEELEKEISRRRRSGHDHATSIRVV